MRLHKLLPAVLLITTLGTCPMAYAQDAGSAPPPHKEHGKKEWEHHHHGMEWSALPEEKRKLLHDTMEKVRKDNAALHEQARKLHGELDALLVAPQFDGDAYQKKSAELDDVHNKIKDNKKQAFASILGQFTQEERIELVVMQHVMKHMKHHHFGHHDGHGGPNGEHGFPHDGAAPHTEAE